MSGLKHLFQPIKIGNMEIKNRIVMPAMGINFGVDEDGNVTPQLWQYYAERASGGTGMIIAGAVAVSPTGRNYERQALFWDDRFIPALKEMTSVVHQNNNVKFGAQLLHAGGQAYHDDKVGPSPIPALAVVQGIPKELTLEGVKEVIESIANAARRAKTAGFDFVEVHAGHGYLIGEFLSPYFNRRQDSYGGSFENRIRFLLEILDNVKKRTSPDFPVGIRINGDDYVKDGWTIEDTKRLAPILENNGADYLNISAGVYGSNPSGITIPSMYSPPGCFVQLAEKIKREVSIPVITAGRIKDVELADKIIGEGKADLVAMGRAHLADPEIANKAKSGNFVAIRPCLGCCLGCIQNVWLGAEATCVMNPEVNREYLFKGRDKVKNPKKILVVGAGSTGLAFAWTAGIRGHKIIIYDRKEHIGGMIPLASIPPKREEFLELVQYYQRELSKLKNVHIRLNVELNEKIIDSINPDVVVLATGSLPEIPQIEGLFDTDMEIRTVIDVLQSNAILGNGVIILGGGQVGLLLADYLAEKGKQVVVLQRSNHFADEMANNDRYFLRERLKTFKVQLYKDVSIKKVLSNGIVFHSKGKEVCLEGFEDLVICESMRPIRSIANLFKDRNIEVYFIGDAKKPRTLLECKTEAYDLGISI